ncbi:MAG: choice-of-anchor I family protein [Bryobacteraceae bacterium]|nr:choice-of-anchor I family protein [Bryobacteraceae bacterium]
MRTPIVLALTVLSVCSAQARIKLANLGVYSAGAGNTTEIAAYDPESKRIFSVNGLLGRLDIINVANPKTPALLNFIATGGFPNSVAVRDGIVAVAVEGTPRTSPGKVIFYDVDGLKLNEVTVGAVPDMLTFTPNGRYVLVANEGEPNSYNRVDSVDPEGSVSVISMAAGVKNLTQNAVRTARFIGNIPQSNSSSIRRYGPNASFAQDMEPEYITVSHDSRTAWVTLQENNAIAVLDISDAAFTRIIGLGFKNHNSELNALDPSDRDGLNNAGAIKIAPWPVFGMYQPDAIDSYRVEGRTYLVMANEGDARDYPGFTEEVRVSALNLDPTAFPNAAALKANAALGRLTVTNQLGDIDGDGDFDRIHPLGARSFTIRDAAGNIVWDSASELERLTAQLAPAIFNSNGAPDTFDTRSDNKGPEPEGVVIGKAYGRTYAFVGLERTGGVMVYDISNPKSPKFIEYFNLSPADISPEGLLFVKADDSPTGKPLLVISHEVSGTLRILEITKVKGDDDDDEDDEDDEDEDDDRRGGRR